MGFFDALKKKSARGGKNSKKDQVKPAVVPVEHVHENKKDETPREKQSVHTSSRAHAVLLHSYVSEKAAVAESLGTYTFVVAQNATKHAVSQAVKDVYGVRPVGIRIIRVEGKQKRVGRNAARQSDWKKAIVALPKGQSIRIHEGV